MRAAARTYGAFQSRRACGSHSGRTGTATRSQFWTTMTITRPFRSARRRTGTRSAGAARVACSGGRALLQDFVVLAGVAHRGHPHNGSGPDTNSPGAAPGVGASCCPRVAPVCGARSFSMVRARSAMSSGGAAPALAIAAPACRGDPAVPISSGDEGSRRGVYMGHRPGRQSGTGEQSP